MRTAILISDNALRRLRELGFKILCQIEDDYIRIYHGEYDIEVTLYKSEERDSYKGVYMSMKVHGEHFKDGKGRNVVSHIERYLRFKGVTT